MASVGYSSLHGCMAGTGVFQSFVLPLGHRLEGDWNLAMPMPSDGLSMCQCDYYLWLIAPRRRLRSRNRIIIGVAEVLACIEGV